jgi:CRISPR-associated endonuclease Cas2
MDYLIIYDLPREKSSLLVKINRELHKIGAERIQHSIWESKKLDNLKDIAELIRDNGGEAMVLEENVVF